MGRTCDFFGCDEALCEAERKLTGSGSRFCRQHRQEFRQYVRAGDVGKMLGFWVRAEGGAERLAKRMAPHAAVGASKIMSYLRARTDEG